MLRFYEAHYPGNWFEPGMLATGHYYALRGPGGLLGVGGVHVYSPRYRVAALGNIAMHSQRRGQGLGRALVAELCRRLLETVDHIGLNVKADNAPAIRCYESVGFEVTDPYEEYLAEPI